MNIAIGKVFETAFGGEVTRSWLGDFVDLGQADRITSPLPLGLVPFELMRQSGLIGIPVIGRSAVANAFEGFEVVQEPPAARTGCHGTGPTPGAV